MKTNQIILCRNTTPLGSQLQRNVHIAWTECRAFEYLTRELGVNTML